MGKKKSVVLTVLVTIVILVLCALVAFPVVTVPGSKGIEKWNPTVLQYDLGAEFNGGHYAYYYPEGVITEEEYKNNVNALTGKELEEYKQSYRKHGSLYLSLDEDDCIHTAGNKLEASADFEEAFDKSVELISERFAERAKYTGSTYRVSVVDDYAIRVELSATENSKEMNSATYASQAFSVFANMGELTIKQDGKVIDELKDKGTSIYDIIETVSVKTQYEIAYLRIQFTDKGEELLKAFKEATEAPAAYQIVLGEETLFEISADTITDKYEVLFGVRYEEERLYADTLCVLINSAMESFGGEDKGGIYVNDVKTVPLTFNVSEVRTYEAIDGEKTVVWVYLGLLAVIVLLAIVTIAKMGGFGVMNVYTTLSYTSIVALCFAFITGGTFAVTLGSIFVFLAGLALTNVLHVAIYNAIKKEVGLGKTVQSAIKSGYKKTLWTVIDVYAVSLLGAIALLIGVAGISTIASQAIICVLAGAFCNLLWGRFINLLLVSASKDKYKHFRFVREDNDDDEE